MSSSSSSDENEDGCRRCQGKLSETVDKPKKKPTLFGDRQDGAGSPSASVLLSANERNPQSCPEQDDCGQIRNMTFLKNRYKNVPEPSEQFLASVNCAVNKLLREIEENHKLCVIKKNQSLAAESRKKME